MEAFLFIGAQGSGKTTFYKERFFETHVRISRDVVRTKHRERVLVAACLAAGQPFVLDNTNARAEARAEHIAAAKAAGFRVVGFFFSCTLAQALDRNRKRPKDQVVPPAGVAATFKRLEPPAPEEGFDEIRVVEIGAEGEFRERGERA